MAIDWSVLADWVAVTLVIMAACGLADSIYKGAFRGRPTGGAPAARPERGESVQVTAADSDLMLLYGEEELKRGELDQCVSVAYSTAEDIMVQAALAVGMPTEHSTLTDFGRRLAAAGYVNLNEQELGLLDNAIGELGQPLDRAMATRALSAAFSVRNYFANSLIAPPRDKKPIGAAEPSTPRA